jgi:hypothetical protein
MKNLLKEIRETIEATPASEWLNIAGVIILIVAVFTLFYFCAFIGHLQYVEHLTR